MSGFKRNGPGCCGCGPYSLSPRQCFGCTDLTTAPLTASIFFLLKDGTPQLVTFTLPWGTVVDDLFGAMNWVSPWQPTPTPTIYWDAGSPASSFGTPYCRMISCGMVLQFALTDAGAPVSGIDTQGNVTPYNNNNRLVVFGDPGSGTEPCSVFTQSCDPPMFHFTNNIVWSDELGDESGCGLPGFTSGVITQ